MSRKVALFALAGELRAKISVKAQRLEGPWKKYIEKAVDEIRARKSGLSREQILPACDDGDPIISGLARQARDGDDAARVVLEDALRERGLYAS